MCFPEVQSVLWSKTNSTTVSWKCCSEVWIFWVASLQPSDQKHTPVAMRHSYYPLNPFRKMTWQGNKNKKVLACHLCFIWLRQKIPLQTAEKYPIRNLTTGVAVVTIAEIETVLRVNHFGWVRSAHAAVCHTWCLIHLSCLTSAFIALMFVQSNNISAAKLSSLWFTLCFGVWNGRMWQF